MATTCYGSHPGEVPSSSNLIVNYLPQSLSDQQFHDLFAQIGPIKTCKIVRNKQTAYSYGFGFVDYHNHDDAQKAIIAYNGYKMDKKTLKVAIAKPSDSNHSKNTNVYIRGVPKNFDPNELEQMFAKFGRLVQFRTLRDTTTNSNKGVAFALYDDRSNADHAISEMEGKILIAGQEPLQVKIADDQMKLRKHQMMSHDPQGRAGGPMYGRMGWTMNGNRNVRFNPMHKGGPGGFQGHVGGYGHANQSPQFDSQQNEMGTSILFVYNIGLETDDHSLVQLFQQYGPVEKASVVKDKQTGKSKGYGFVTMGSYYDAYNAIDQLNGFHYAGNQLQVSFKTPKSPGMGGLSMGSGGGGGPIFGQSGPMSGPNSFNNGNSGPPSGPGGFSAGGPTSGPGGFHHGGGNGLNGNGGYMSGPMHDGFGPGKRPVPQQFY